MPGGRFLLRFEDLDSARVRPGCAQAQADSLAWLGLDWDGEPVAAVAAESSTTPRSRRCEERGVLYECFCSRADVRRAASAPHGPDGPLYSGACRDLSRERARGAGQPADRPRCACACRARSSSATTSWGRSARRSSATSGDIVVRRSDGVIAYQLAVVVDDAAQGVTHVVRGADLLASTARQIQLYRAARPDPRAGATRTSRCCSATTASASPSGTAPSV